MSSKTARPKYEMTTGINSLSGEVKENKDGSIEFL
jgi:hypothetical protein